jgi:sodium transport system permease protein
MGPLVVGVVMLARVQGPANAGMQFVLPLMASVFAMMAAFSGGMSVAMDTVAGERERRSLLPLLLSPASRAELVLGKWLATTVFAAAGAIANFIAFAKPVRGRGIGESNVGVRLNRARQLLRKQLTNGDEP